MDSPSQMLLQFRGVASEKKSEVRQSRQCPNPILLPALMFDDELDLGTASVRSYLIRGPREKKVASTAAASISKKQEQLSDEDAPWRCLHRLLLLEKLLLQPPRAPPPRAGESREHRSRVHARGRGSRAWWCHQAPPRLRNISGRIASWSKKSIGPIEFNSRASTGKRKRAGW